jgi:transposase-like protein
LRDIEELFQERCLEADHTTVWRWVQRYGAADATTSKANQQVMALR